MAHFATGTLEFRVENLEHLINILYLNAFMNKDTDHAVNCVGFNTDIFKNKLSLIQDIEHVRKDENTIKEFEPSVENYVKTGIHGSFEIISPHWLRNHFDEYAEHFGNNFFQNFLQENKEWILDFLDAHPHKGSIYTSLYDLAKDSEDSELCDLLQAKNAIFL